MKINSRACNEVTILDINGRIVLGDEIAIFKQSISTLIESGRKRVLLNLRDVPYIDSSGIGELVSAFTKIRNSGGELKLLNLAPKVKTLLEITRLYTVFDVREDEAAAVLSFTRSLSSSYSPPL
jgi:anti-sigma B factor antagonist